MDGQVALITGAARGQGRAHALALAKAGADIVACDVPAQFDVVPYNMGGPTDMARTATLVEGLGSRCLARSVDVRDSAAVDGLVAEAISEFGRIDVLCANAGIVVLAPLASTSDEVWNTTIATNLGGVFNSIRAVAPHMIDRRYGRIIATSSMIGRQGMANLSAYAAAKWGIIGLVKTAALELGEHNITVNAVCPSYVDTPMINHEFYNRVFRPDLEAPTRETSEEIVRAGHPMNVGSLPPEDISGVVCFLASDAGRYISGAAIDVTAGMSGSWTA